MVDKAVVHKNLSDEERGILYAETPAEHKLFEIINRNGNKTLEDLSAGNFEKYFDDPSKYYQDKCFPFYHELHRYFFDRGGIDALFKRANLPEWKDKDTELILDTLEEKVKEEEKTAKKEEAKKKSKTPKEEKVPSIEDIKSMEDFNGTGIIANYVIYKKLFNGLPRRFIVKAYLEDGEIKEEVDPEVHSIPEQTAPSVDFYETNYGEFKEIFTELKGVHQDYVFFTNRSIYPTLTTLGSMASYFREAFYTYPYFDFISGEAESGKTTAMKTQVFTSFYGTVASSVSEALLFREIDSSHCFYGLDNIERLFAKPKDYAGIIDWLLSSYARDIPCRRLAKVGDTFEVVSFDGYGEKAFTHITDFPVSLSTLKSRCIQIVMQKGRPTKYYPTPEKFAAIRDKMYNARIRDYQKVTETYEEFVSSNILIGRTGDLYYPLLAIAKLISKEVYEEVLKYAKDTEKERTEPDEWNRELINFLYEEGIYGSISPKDVREQYQDRLHDAGLLKEEGEVKTRTVTNKLKKLGFERDSKKTENKTWFIIDQKTISQRAYEYGILNTPQNANFFNLPNSSNNQKEPKEEGAGEDSNKETRSGENEPNENEEEKKLTKLGKLANTEVLREEKQKPAKLVCVCGKCFDTVEVLRHHQAKCPDFQAKQSRDARKRLEEEESLKINGK